MDLLTLIVSVAGIAALVVQSVSSFCKVEKQNALGVIDATLAALGAGLVWSMINGGLVIGTDFGLVMVQGPWIVRLLRFALVIGASLAPLCWNRARALNGWASSRIVATLGGAAVGAWAAAHVTVLNPADGALQFYAYDVWWPPLTIWVTVCLSGCVAALVGIIGPLRIIEIASAVLVPLAAFGYRWPTLVDRGPDWAWRAIESGAFLVAAAALALRFILSQDAILRWTTAAAAGVVAALWLVHRTLAASHGQLRIALGLVPLAVVIIELLAMIAEHRNANGAAVGPSRLHVAALSLSLPVIVACSIDFSTIGWMPRWIDIGVIVGCWILFAERLGDKVLTVSNLRGIFRFAAVTIIWQILQRAWDVAKQAGTVIGASFSTANNASWAIALKGVLALVAALFVVTVVSEAWSARPIVVQPFQWNGSSKDDDGKTEATAISGAVINALGRIRSDLVADQSLTLKEASGTGPPELLPLLARADSNALESAVAQSSDIDISGLKVSVKFFVPLVQDMVRALFGVRVIDGSVAKTGGHLTVLMSSSKGESWREIAPSSMTPPETEGSCRLDMFADGASAVAERLAFDIVSADPRFSQSGLTRDFDAFLFYREGLKLWDRYETAKTGESGTSQALRTAIDCFREATTRDHTFAQSYYHLGLALQRDGQPLAAIDAFRLSAAGDLSVSAMLQEGVTQYSFSSFYVNQSGLLPPVDAIDGAHAQLFGVSMKSALLQRRDQARALWSTIAAASTADVSRPARRAAYFGICQYETDNLFWETTPVNFYVPYFYCSRAEALWSWPAPERSERMVESGVLLYLGLALAGHQTMWEQIPATAFPEQWTCAESSYSVTALDEAGQPINYFVKVSHRLNRAVEYYRRSLELVPTDNYTRCMLATALMSRGRSMSEMETLLHESNAHLAVGNDLLSDAERAAHETSGDEDAQQQSAKNATNYYRLALREFDRAVGLDSNALEALNTYGYAVWKWRLNAINGGVSEAPDEKILATAERYARESRRLSAAWRMGDMEKSTRSTIGELLVALGRPAEARDVLKTLLGDSPNWQSADEVRWDLAQATLCLARRASAADALKLRGEAQALYDEIRSHEEIRDRRGFAEAMPDAVDLALRESACPPAPDDAAPATAEFTLAKPSYAAGSSCGSVSVTAQLPPGETDTYYLRVWGNGIDRRIDLHDGRARSISLMLKSFKPDLYFSRLETDAGAAVSATIRLEPPASGGCQTSLNLAFHRPSSR